MTNRRVGQRRRLSVRVEAFCSLPGRWASKISLSPDKEAKPRQNSEGSALGS